jgi:hypothetical protein
MSSNIFLQLHFVAAHFAAVPKSLRSAPRLCQNLRKLASDCYRKSYGEKSLYAF